MSTDSSADSLKGDGAGTGPNLDGPTGTAVTRPAPRAGRYVKSIIVKTQDDPTGIEFIASDNGSELPTDLRNLWNEILLTARLASNLYRKNLKARKDIFETLYYAADTGLRGERLADGASNLNAARVRIADLFPFARNRTWRTYLFWIILCAVPLLLVGALLIYLSEAKYFDNSGIFSSLNKIDPKPHNIDPNINNTNPNLDNAHPKHYPLQLIIALAAVWIPAGTMIGVFIEFIFSVDNDITFSDLLKINPARWVPTQVIINTTFVAWAFAFIMGANIIQVGVFSVLLNDFMDDKPFLLLVTGFLVGFAYSYVKNIMYTIRPGVKEI